MASSVGAPSEERPTTQPLFSSLSGLPPPLLPPLLPTSLLLLPLLPPPLLFSLLLLRPPPSTLTLEGSKQKPHKVAPEPQSPPQQPALGRRVLARFEGPDLGELATPGQDANLLSAITFQVPDVPGCVPKTQPLHLGMEDDPCPSATPNT